MPVTQHPTHFCPHCQGGFVMPQAAPPSVGAVIVVFIASVLIDVALLYMIFIKPFITPS